KTRLDFLKYSVSGKGYGKVIAQLADIETNTYLSHLYNTTVFASSSTIDLKLKTNGQKLTACSEATIANHGT
ncbi:hypothetical protein M8C21_025887, partial [Ambrosia artemisiifolia]